MKYVLAVVMLMMVSMGAWADGDNFDPNSGEVKELNECRGDHNKIDKDDSLIRQKTIDLLDDPDGSSFIGGSCTKATFDWNDNKVTARWVGRTDYFDKGWNWDFKLQAPLELKDQMDVRDIDFDGMANALKINAGIHYQRRKGDDGDNSSFYRAGLDAAVAFESFDYIYGTEINNMQNDRLTHESYRMYGAYYSASESKFVAGIAYNYEHSFKAGDKQNICVDTGLTTSQCASVIVGAPTKTTKHFVEFNGYWAFQDSDVNTGLKIKHDIKNSVTKVDVPFYRQRDGSEDILGGIIFSWDSLTRQWRTTLMVGSTFGFLD